MSREALRARAIEIVLAARELEQEKREAFLERRCAGEPELRVVVRDMVKADAERHWLDGAAREAFPSLHERAGERVQGYRIIGELGRGAMGVVYLAHDESVERRVALKVLPATAGDDAHARRLLREARVAAKLDHPGVAPVYGAGRDGSSVFVVTGYVEGEPLHRRLTRVGASSAPATRDCAPAALRDQGWVSSSVRMVAAVASALEHAHRAGVVHRDVKPSNIIIDAGGEPRLVDFGIASLPAEPLETRLSSAGTIAYLSPERAREERPEPDPRDDVYSLGVVLYECLTGRLPYEADSLAALLRGFEGDLPLRIGRLNPSVPSAVERVCMRALAIDPVQRYASAASFGEDLRRALAGEPIAGLHRLARPRRWLWRRRRRLVAAGLVAVAASFSFAIGRHDPPPRGGLAVEAPPGITASVRPVDEASRLPLAPIITRDTPFLAELPAGDYRVTIEAPGGSLEMTRTIAQDEVVSVAPPATRRPLSLDGMIFFPAGPAVIGRPGDPDPTFGARTVEFEAFWIDRYEVSNADYRAFVEAAGASPPDIWPDPYDPALDELPVVGVTKAEAQAYAEWAGKRLPTDQEWERAAMGGENRSYPWGESAPERWPAPVPPGFWGVRPGSPEGRAMYLEGVRPVSAATQDVTSDGGHWFYGNVAEWTESTTIFTSPTTQEQSRICIVKGTNWNRAGASSGDLAGAMYVGPQRAGVHLGFRCAVSVDVASGRPAR